MKTIDTHDNLGLMLEFPQDGRPLLTNETYYWNSTFRNIITAHTKSILPFPDAQMTIKNGDNCTGVLFFKNTAKRGETVAHSLSIKDGIKIPRREIIALQAAITHLHDIAMSNSCSQTNATFLKDFVLPHPEVMPEAWRIGDKDGRLIVLWGYSSNSSDATFLPLSPTAKQWQDAGKRKDLAALLAPYSTAFAISWKRLAILAGVVLLAVILCLTCCRSGKPGSTGPQPDMSQMVQEVMQDTAIPDDVKVIYRQAAAVDTSDEARNQALGVYDERRTQGLTTPAEDKLADYLRDTPTVIEEKAPITSPEDLQKSYDRTQELQKIRNGYSQKGDELAKQFQTEEQKINEQNQKAEQTILQTVSDIQKDTTVPESNKKIYEQCTEDEHARQKAMDAVSQREKDGTATDKERVLKTQLEQQAAAEKEQQTDQAKHSEVISVNDANIQKVDEQLRQEENRRYDYAQNHADDVNKLPAEQKNNLHALLSRCPVCHQETISYAMKYIKGYLDNDNFYHFYLHLKPSCTAVSDITITSFKVDSFFQRDNSFNPETNILTFKLKESEINSGDLKVITEVEARHHSAAIKTTVPLTLNVGAKHTYKNITITIKK